MRRRVTGWLVVPLVAAIGCGEPPATDAPAVETSATEPAVEAPYELDVIVEADPDEGAPPLRVRFSADIGEDEGGPWTFRWEFGDGSVSEEKDPEHVYAEAGDYTAVLTMTDQRGFSGQDEIDVFVEPE